ncbi:MAG: hypothetical protein RIT36_1344, partial [Bacteroidota bacterium]
IPNDRAYCETCSSIGLTFWNRRMTGLYGDAKYADLVELTMYNAAIAGVSISGDRFFYTNPLESQGKNKRNTWDDPPCCPSNIVRFLPEIGSTIYGKRDKEIYINQFIANKAKISVANQEINLNMETGYPWEGSVSLKIDPETPVDFAMYIRIPGWAQNQLLPGGLYHYVDGEPNSGKSVLLKVNGSRISKINMVNGYAVIKRKWKKGDSVELALPMNPRLIAGNSRIADTHGKVVIMRGPLVYCIEETDNKKYFEEGNGAMLGPVAVTPEFKTDLLNGIWVINCKVTVPGKKQEMNITAIPYYAWCNREQGQMKVWLPFSQND